MYCRWSACAIPWAGTVFPPKPTSRRSSRTPSPMNNSQTMDALEGQFTSAPLGEQAKPMTPPLSQEIQGRGTPPKQPTYSQHGPPPNVKSPVYGPPPTGMPQRPGPPSGSSQNYSMGTGPPSGPTNFKPGPPTGPPNYNLPQGPQPGPTQNMYQSSGPPSGPTNFGMPPTSGQYGQPPPPPTGYQPPPTGPNTMPSRPGYPPSSQGLPPQQQMYGQTGPQQQGDGYGSGQYNNMPNVGGMSLSDDSRVVNLLQEKQLIPADGIENPKIKLHNDFKKVNCSPDILRCTLTSIPQTSSLLNKSRLPLGILIHPFKDLSQLPVIQSIVILRPPQPAVYLYLLDVSFNAIETGYLNTFCQTLLDELDKIPSDSRTQIGFLCYDCALYFFNLEENLSQPQMLIVSDVDDVFLPCPDNLLVNLQESKEMVSDLLNQLPTLFESNRETGSALGAALQAAYKLIHSTGGRITVVQTVLPTIGPGGLENREDPNQRTTKNVTNLGPSTDF
ncbi:SEC24 [Mytilus edulis]|uniref:SEC24 n=1 Tax=Mytilus edulis TaxID=6550 RepID=A0A8S3SC13_MYTED|nr:SEC24 [Mytilus edulis]